MQENDNKNLLSKVCLSLISVGALNSVICKLKGCTDIDRNLNKNIYRIRSSITCQSRYQSQENFDSIVNGDVKRSVVRTELVVKILNWRDFIL